MQQQQQQQHLEEDDEKDDEEYLSQSLKKRDKNIQENKAMVLNPTPVFIIFIQHVIYVLFISVSSSLVIAGEAVC